MTKKAGFTPISWDQAFDVMEEKFKTALKEKGPESIGMFGSGQWTIWEGYAASKLFKAGSVHQHRPERTSLYGVGSSWLYAYLWYG